MKQIWTLLRCSRSAQLNQLNQQRQLFVGTTQLQQQQQVSEKLNHTTNLTTTRTDEEWINAKEFETIPGPTRWTMIKDFIPGGKLYKANLVQIIQTMHERYGDIFCMKGEMGKPNTVFTYNAADIESTYRHEGLWPARPVLETIKYFRTVKRPDVYHGYIGLISAQGKDWADMRNKVNPIMLKTKNVRQNLPTVDKISMEFVERIESLRDRKTHMVDCNFQEELRMWAFESIGYIALNVRLNVMNENANENALKLSKYLCDFLQYTFDYDVAPSFWKYYETPGFKRLMLAHDNITNIATTFIDEAMSKFDTNGQNSEEGTSVLEQLCRVDKKIAIVVGIDMLMAGMDAASAAFLTILYLMARHPEKQEILRRELMAALPDPDSPLTDEIAKELNYLRACFKEGHRVTPVIPVNSRILIKDLVMSGYKVPKGTGIHINNMELCHMEEYFPRCNEFLPERWLKSGDIACPEARTESPFVYMPFGFGPRTCVGKRIAEMEMEALLARLIRKYEITWEDKEDMKYVSNIIMLPHGSMKFKFKPL